MLQEGAGFGFGGEELHRAEGQPGERAGCLVDKASHHAARKSNIENRGGRVHDFGFGEVRGSLARARVHSARVFSIVEHEDISVLFSELAMHAKEGIDIGGPDFALWVNEQKRAFQPAPEGWTQALEAL